MSRPARVMLNLEALQHNLQQVREHAPGAKVMAVVKAAAYGHGALTCARALEPVDAFGVASLEEAVGLRDGNIKTPIVLLEGIFSAAELPTVRAQNLDLVLHNHRQLQWLEAEVVENKTSAPVRIWLKINTGMGRLGFNSEEVTEIRTRLAKLNWIDKEVILMSHLARADNPEDAYTNLQVQQFNQVRDLNPDCQTSLANSAGILFWPDTHGNWVRPGIMLYGISPDPRRQGHELGLLPVMSVMSEIIEVRQCQQGEGVGYGHKWVCPEDMSVGIVAFGYGDGYPRNLSVGTPVVVNGNITTVLGRVSMDMLAVDLRPCPHSKVGDPVELWGEHLPVERVAAQADTIAYELVCRITPRVQVFTC